MDRNRLSAQYLKSGKQNNAKCTTPSVSTRQMEWACTRTWKDYVKRRERRAASKSRAAKGYLRDDLRSHCLVRARPWATSQGRRMKVSIGIYGACVEPGQKKKATLPTKNERGILQIQQSKQAANKKEQTHNKTESKYRTATQKEQTENDVLITEEHWGGNPTQGHTNATSLGARCQ